MPEKTLVIGVGVARSGTNFLSYLLDLQPDCFFTHEAYLFDWDKSIHEHESFDNFQYLLSQDGTIVGDVGLGYVNHWEEIMDKFPQCKMVFLLRDPEDNFRSLMTSCGDTAFFTDVGPGHPMYNDYWWRKFPAWQNHKEQNILQYIDGHHSRALRASIQYPNRVHIAKLEELNTLEGKRNLFDFCGISTHHRIYTAEKTNIHKPNGNDKYINPKRKQIV